MRATHQGTYINVTGRPRTMICVSALSPPEMMMRPVLACCRAAMATPQRKASPVLNASWLARPFEMTPRRFTRASLSFDARMNENEYADPASPPTTNDSIVATTTVWSGRGVENPSNQLRGSPRRRVTIVAALQGKEDGGTNMRCTPHEGRGRGDSSASSHAQHSRCGRPASPLTSQIRGWQGPFSKHFHPAPQGQTQCRQSVKRRQRPGRLRRRRKSTMKTPC